MRGINCIFRAVGNIFHVVKKLAAYTVSLKLWSNKKKCNMFSVVSGCNDANQKSADDGSVEFK